MTAECVSFSVVLTGCVLLCLHIVLTVCLNVSVSLLRQDRSTKLSPNKLNRVGFVTEWWRSDGNFVSQVCPRKEREIHFREKVQSVCVNISVTHRHTETEL